MQVSETLRSLECRSRDKDIDPSRPECYTTSSETFRIWRLMVLGRLKELELSE
jgi:hypothetical protein